MFRHEHLNPLLSVSACPVQAILLIGFSEDQFSTFKQMMDDMDATMFQIYSAGESQLRSKLCDAFETPGFKPAPLGARRAVILSGMYTSEVRYVCCKNPSHRSGHAPHGAPFGARFWRARC